MSEVLAAVAAAPQEITTLTFATMPVTMGAFTPEAMFAPGNVRALVTQIETDARAAAALLDISTEKGRRAIASLANKVARSKTAIDDAGKELNAAKRAEIDKVDGERRYAREALDALKAEVRRDLTAWEDADKARVVAHEAALADIAALHTDLPANASTAEIAGRLAQLQTNQPRDWQEFAVPARKAIEEAVAGLQAAWDAASRREEEAAAEKQRRADETERRRQENIRLQLAREAQIAAEAAEAARIAVAAEIEQARASLAQAEAARAAAEAQAQAYQDRWDAAALAPQAADPAAVVAEPDRGEAKAPANSTLRLTVERLAMDALITVGLSKNAAKMAIHAIAAGTVPHVSIQY